MNMDNSFLTQNLQDVKRQIYDIYDESKKAIENHSQVINKHINLIKKEHELFLLKSLDLLTKSENDLTEPTTMTRISCSTNSNAVLTTGCFSNDGIRKKSRSPYQRSSNQTSYKETFIKDRFDLVHSLKKKSIKDLRKGNSKPKTTTTRKQIENLLKTKSKLEKVNLSVSDIKKQKNKKQQKFNGNLIYQQPSLFKESYKRTITTPNSKISNNAIIAITGDEKKFEEDEKIKRDQKRKLTQEIRKFSIIDIPCINLDAQPIQTNISIENTSNSDRSLDCLSNNLKIVDELINKKDKFCFLMAKSEILPLKLKILFLTFNKKIYQMYSLINLLKEHYEFLDTTIKNTAKSLSQNSNFRPSNTAQISLNCIIEKDFIIFSKTSNPTQTHLNLLKILLIIFTNDFSFESKNSFCELISEIQRLLTVNISISKKI